MSYNPQIVGFSCYIWNISIIYELCNDLRKINPDIKILLGGPEVTYEPEEALQKSGADIIVRGEGEEVIIEAVRLLQQEGHADCPGLYYKKNGQITDTGIAVTKDLSEVPTPFTEYMMQREKGRLIYYEGSRGCPYNCIYCLSSATTGVRYFPLNRVFSDLDSILKYNPKTVKFTDRSFNTNESRTLAILEYLMKLDTDTCFHLEIFPAGLTKKVMTHLAHMPVGRVQLEAGIQSVNPHTLEASGRNQDADKALANMKCMTKSQNMHIHLDLIAGLPYEDLDSFRNSFNKTLDAAPHMLQLGFLKLLKGTTARSIPGYESENSPPYEVLSTPWLSFEELSEIKTIEKCVELFYNTGRFKSYLSYMHNKSASPYSFYKNLTDYLNSSGSSLTAISRDGKYLALADFSKYEKIALEHLRYDYMISYSSKTIPKALGESGIEKDQLFSFLKIEDNRSRYFSEFTDSSPKKLYKICAMGEFDFGLGREVFLFKYNNRNPVTGLYEKFSVQI